MGWTRVVDVLKVVLFRMFCAKCWTPVTAHERVCRDCAADLTAPGSVRLTDPRSVQRDVLGVPVTSSGLALNSPEGSASTGTGGITESGLPLVATAHPAAHPAATTRQSGASSAAPPTLDASPTFDAPPLPPKPIPAAPGSTGAGWWGSMKATVLDLGQRAAVANEALRQQAAKVKDGVLAARQPVPLEPNGRRPDDPGYQALPAHPIMPRDAAATPRELHGATAVQRQPPPAAPVPVQPVAGRVHASLSPREVHGATAVQRQPRATLVPVQPVAGPTPVLLPPREVHGATAVQRQPPAVPATPPTAGAAAPAPATAPVSTTASASTTAAAVATAPGTAPAPATAVAPASADAGTTTPVPAAVAPAPAVIGASAAGLAVQDRPDFPQRFHGATAIRRPEVVWERTREPDELSLWDDYGMADSGGPVADPDAPLSVRAAQVLGASALPTAKVLAFAVVLALTIIVLVTLVSRLLTLDAVVVVNPAPEASYTPVPTVTTDPEPEPEVTSEPEPEPQGPATPMMAPGAKECDPGVWAGQQTSCALANSVGQSVDRDITEPVIVEAFSSSSNRTYRLECTPGEGITCTGLDGVQGVDVWIVTGIESAPPS